MNILFLNTHFNTGGITSYLLTLSKALVKRGHKVFIMSSGGNCVQMLERMGVEHITINIKTKSELSWRVYWYQKHVQNVIVEHNIDVLHTHTRITQIMGTLISRRMGVAHVTTCHGFFKPKMARRLVKGWGDAVIAISNPVREHLIKDLGVSSKRTFLIPNGIDLDRFKPFNEQKVQELRHQWNVSGHQVIGVIARLSDVKGHKYLINALPLIIKECPQVKCMVVGIGPMEKQLKQMVKSQKLSNYVDFYKTVNQTPQMLALFDVFVLPSIAEGLGLSAMEAQACALPVVASSVGGLTDLIKDKVTGRLVPSQNSTELANAIIEVLKDPQTAINLGQNASRFIQDNYSHETMAEQTIKVYERAIQHSVL